MESVTLERILRKIRGKCWFSGGSLNYEHLKDQQPRTNGYDSFNHTSNPTGSSPVEAVCDLQIYDFVGPSGHSPMSIYEPSPFFLHCLEGRATVLYEGALYGLAERECGFFHTRSHMLTDTTRIIVPAGWRARVAKVKFRTDIARLGTGLEARTQALEDIPFDPRPLNNVRLRSLFMDTPWKNEIGYEYVELLPGAFVDVHIHTQSDAVVYVTKGSGWFLAETEDSREDGYRLQKLYVEAGGYGVIPRGQWHGVEAGLDGFEFISLQVKPIGNDYIRLDPSRYEIVRELILPIENATNS